MSLPSRPDLYRAAASGVTTRWVSFENPTGAAGGGALTNRGAKGNAFEGLAAGETKPLLEIGGSGEIRRIWITVNDRTPKALRSLRLDMTWDGAQTPAVSAPLGDFFGVGLGRTAAFESELFASPEGRSFCCFVPMPFRTGARITLTNESATPITHVFYDIELLSGVDHDDDVLYCHAHWRRESPNVLGAPFEILPHVTGRGRYLGCNIGIVANELCPNWWGEGEVKLWLDGYGEHPSLCGTGAEDFVGSAWGLGAFSNRTQGCTVCDEAARQYAFYRFHTIDPIYFHRECRAAIDTIGGAPVKDVIDMQQRGVPVVPVTIDTGKGHVARLLEVEPPVDLLAHGEPDQWCNHFRVDDWSSTAYFYLDRPENGLPALPPADIRTAGLGS